jgi:HEAT repeat protein
MEDNYLKKLNSDNNDEISSALYIILHDPDQAKYLDKIIQHLDNKDVDVRWPATMLIAKIRDRKTISYLEKLLQDNNEKIRIEAALGLAKYRNRKCLSSLKEVIENDYLDHSVHKRAIEALGRFKDEDLLPILKIGLFHRRKASRIKSVDAIAKIDSEESIALLKEALVPYRLN